MLGSRERNKLVVTMMDSGDFVGTTALQKIIVYRKKDILNYPADNESFSAHRIVLAATIPYFHAMFTHDMVESKQKEITIQGIDSGALEALINFAYSGRVIIDSDNVQSLMVGASFLQLHKVRDACAEFLNKRFHPNNVLGIRAFADTFGCNSLVEAANKYIQQYFHDVSMSEEYMSLSCTDLRNIVMRDELHILTEEQVFEAVMRWVHKNSESRKKDLPQLLGHVRLPLLTPHYLADRVAAEELIKSSHECRQVLCDSVSTVEVFDPAAGRWQLAEAMSMMRSRVGVAVMRNKLYALGGYNGQERLSAVEVFDPLKRVWNRITSMRCRRSQIVKGRYLNSAVGAAAFNDQLFACGGYDGVSSLNTVECYTPDNDNWTPVASMLKHRSAGGVAAFQGFIYALGGHDGLSIFDSVERYDPLLGQWSSVVSMLTRRCRLGVASLNSKLYVCGGYDGSTFLQTVEMFDPATNQWKYVAPMNVMRSRVALVANLGKLWAIGGYDGVTNLSTVEVYDPNTDSWSFVAPMCAHEGGVGVGVIPIC
uniref:Kelch-like protein diablo n=1 Tax=Timema douglasi TaxID=61478 RepID=A0A7R8Z570_TIMDO|nr:unnamed protein product [Timema douglasi]